MSSNHFGDYEHLIQFKVTNISNAGHLLGYWAVSTTRSSTLANMYFYNEGNCGYCTESSGSLNVKIRDYENGVTDTYVGSFNTDYYVTIKRSGTALTEKIYSDATHLTLLDTLSVVSGTMAYDYVYGCFARGNQAYTSSHTVEKLDIQEAIAIIGKSARILVTEGIVIR